MVNDTREQKARDEAITHLKKRRDFFGHVLIYALVNTFLVVIWAVTGGHGFFWPIFLIVGWGIGVVMNAWDVFWRHEITEADIQREMEREDR
jgi:hypothetical protein